jgi:hypothetical protein
MSTSGPMSTSELEVGSSTPGTGVFSFSRGTFFHYS